MENFMNETCENTFVNTGSYDENTIDFNQTNINLDNFSSYSDNAIQVYINSKCVLNILKTLTSLLKQAKVTVSIFEKHNTNNNNNNQTKDNRIIKILKKEFLNAKIIISGFNLKGEFDVLVRLFPNESQNYKTFESINFTFEMENYYFNYIFSKYACNQENSLFLLPSKDNKILNMIVFNSKDIADFSYKFLIEYIFDYNIPIDSKSFKAPIISTNQQNIFSNFTNETTFLCLNKKFIETMMSLRKMTKNNDLKIFMSNSQNVIYSDTNMNNQANMMNGKIQSLFQTKDNVIFSKNFVKNLIESQNDRRQSLESYSFSMTFNILKAIGILNPLECFNEILNGYKINDNSPIIWLVVDIKNKNYSFTSSINMIISNLITNQNNINYLSNSSSIDFKYEINIPFSIESSRFDLNDEISKHIWENQNQMKKTFTTDQSFNSAINFDIPDDILDDFINSKVKSKEKEKGREIEKEKAQDRDKDNKHKVSLNSTNNIGLKNEVEISTDETFESCIEYINNEYIYDTLDF